ncbi:MAG: pentapeptide repeat-containing protein [Actinomycetota bacterium]|nr:pentapeptide repeat-containing protein [Actinomycetota bacterium]
MADGTLQWRRPDEVPWPTCSAEDCWGVVLEDGRCFVHGTKAARDNAVRGAFKSNKIDFARGLVLDSDSLENISEAYGVGVEYRRSIAKADFTLAVFVERAEFSFVDFGTGSFREAQFLAGASFAECEFSRVADFGGAVFGDSENGAVSFRDAKFADANFSGATFDRGARFTDAIFNEKASFYGATFGNDASFYEATFANEAEFDEADFGEDASFSRATFAEAATFRDARFDAEASFDEATFGPEASFSGTRFHRECSFNRVVFGPAAILGPMLVTGLMRFERATIERPDRVEISAGAISWNKLMLPAGGTLRVRWAEVSFEDAGFAQPTIVAPFELPPHEETEPLSVTEERAIVGFLSGGRPGAANPRLVSLRRADVSLLVLTDVDLAPCSFAGAHNLDRLRIEGLISFARAPSRLGRGRGRQAIAEEHRWRGRPGAKRGWDPPSCHTALLDRGDDPALGPLHISSLYRALRKSREDGKDEPGAADFYYGEMEMRRKSPATPFSDRAILFLYWLVSGYGLRASRAAASLLVTVLVAAGLLQAGGVACDGGCDEGFGRMAILSARSVIGLIRPFDQDLTLLGEVVQLCVRLLGPLFLGLTLLSLRARLKR